MISVRAFVLVLCVVHSGFARGVSFDALLEHPDRFHRQRVTVKGVLEVTGSVELYLWRDAGAYRRGDVKKLVTVVQRGKDIDRSLRRRPPRAPHSDANLHWVRLTGTVDTRLHGRFGDEDFQLLLTRLETLPLPRVPQR